MYMQLGLKSKSPRCSPTITAIFLPLPLLGHAEWFLPGSQTLEPRSGENGKCVGPLMNCSNLLNINGLHMTCLLVAQNPKNKWSWNPRNPLRSHRTTIPNRCTIKLDVEGISFVDNLKSIKSIQITGKVLMILGMFCICESRNPECFRFVLFPCGIFHRKQTVRWKKLFRLESFDTSQN
jgi:hypothetical protein